MRKLFLVGVAILAFSSMALANSIIPTFNGVTSSAGGFTYSYDLNLDGSSDVVTGSRFILFDFLGFTGTSSAPAGWALTTPSTGPSAPSPFVNPAESGAPNLVWTYTGTTIPGGTLLGTITAESVSGPGSTPNLVYSGVDQARSNGSDQANFGTTRGPVVPEPTSLLLLGSGLLGFAGFAGRKLFKG